MPVSRYPKGIETKNAIITETKRLFYEKGFFNTTVAEICRNINIKGGTFTYYFKNKNDVAKEIYKELAQRCNEYVSEIEPVGLTTLQKNTRGNFVLYLAQFRDINAAKYHYQLISDESLKDICTNYVSPIYKKFNTELALGLSEKELQEVILSDFGSRRELTLNYLESNNFDCHYEDIIEFAATANAIMGRIFMMDKHKMQAAISEAKMFVAKHDYSHIRLLI